MLSDLEAQVGWRTTRRQRPVVIMGWLDGILTTVRNLRREQPLETITVETTAGPITVPTPAEILRIEEVTRRVAVHDEPGLVEGDT